MSNRKFIVSILLVSFLFTICLSGGVYAFSDKVSSGSLSAQTVQSNSNPSGDGNLPEEPGIESLSAILIESGRGQVLYSKNSDLKLHISAACKIMTALVTIEKQSSSLKSDVIISKESVDTEGAALNLVVGEKYTIEDLLYAVMLRSANDAAIALAEYVGGDVETFVAMMNDLAARLNLKNTHFSNPTGLYDETQYTTAHDIAMLIKYAISNPTFNKIFSTKSRPWINADGSTSILVSQNTLFWAYNGVDGGKVGFNNEEQYSVITTATRNNQRLISVVLYGPKNSIFDDTQKLFDYGFNNFMTGILVHKGEVLKTIQVGDTSLNLISIADVYYTYPIGQSYIKNFVVNVNQDLAPPIKRNFSVGTAKFVLMDDTVIDVSLYPENDIEPPEDFKSKIINKIKENRDIFYLVAVLVVIEILMALYKIFRLIVKLFTKIRNKNLAK